MEISSCILDMLLYGRIDRHGDGKNNNFNKQKISTATPHEIFISQSTIPGAGYGVFSTTVIKKGTDIGPYPGNFVSNLDFRKSDSSWEIFNVNGVILGFINGGTHSDHWIMHVQCARSEREQNLEIIQLGTKLFYRAFRDIGLGEELFVWYGKDYNLYMGIPYWNKTKNERLITEEEHVEESTKDLTLKGRWQCVLCQRGFNSRSNLRSHMRIHTLEKPFSCKYCSRKFSQSSTLRNHIRLHTGEKPYKCIRCNSCYSQLAGLRAHQRSSTHKPSLH